MTADLESLRSFGCCLLDEAGAIALKYFRRHLPVENKKKDGNFDPVTQADREVELFIRERITSAFPDHGIIGEEFGSVNTDSSSRWIIDPIDGTRAFMSGMTGWGILLGLIENNQPTLGFMHQPYLEETWTGTPDGASLIRRGKTQSLATGSTTRLMDSVLYCTHPEMFRSKKRLANFESLAAKVKLMRYGGDCYAYCLLAMGFVDIIVEDALEPYDILPLVPIIEAAGGVVTDIEGQVPHQGGLVVTAATQSLHEQVLDHMRSGIEAVDT